MIIQAWGKYFWLKGRHSEEDHEVQAAKDMQDMLRYDQGEILSIEVDPEKLTYYAEVETKQYTPDRWKSFGIRTNRKDKYDQMAKEPWNVRMKRAREAGKTDEQRQTEGQSWYDERAASIKALQERMRRERDQRGWHGQRPETLQEEWNKEPDDPFDESQVCEICGKYKWESGHNH